MSEEVRGRRAMLQLIAASGAALALPRAAAAQAKSADPVRAFVEKNHDANVKRLQDWIRLPGIAAENRNMNEACAQMVELAREAGFADARRVETKGHPCVFGTMDVGAKQTLGVYFMYDVKQADPAEWSSPPFEAALVDKPGFGKVVMGRGATNQKGPESAFLAALRALKAVGRKPPVNLVLICEGEEEIGSPNFRDAVERPEVLATFKRCSGVMLPMNCQNPAGGVSVNLGAKGIVELELVVSGEKWGRGPVQDVHSSQKAALDSPAWRLVQALQSLVSADGNDPAIDGWFENVKPLTARQKELVDIIVQRTPEAAALKNLGAKQWVRGLSYREAMERLVSQPTVNIEGLVSGYTGPGGKTILPGKAVAKLDLRLVPDMTFDEAVRKLKAHLAKRGFADVEVNVSGGYDPTQTDENSGLIRATQATYRKAGIEPTLNPRLAGSWPGYLFTSPPLSLPAGHFGLGHGSGAHAPDEYMVIESANSKVAGYDGAVMSYVDFLQQMAVVR